MATDAPQISGAVLRSYLDELRRMGAYEEVLARISADAKQLAWKPPLPITWVDAQLTSQFLVALDEARGRDAVVEFGLRITRDRLSGMVRRLLQTSAKLFGATPSSFFSRFESFTGLMVRGVRIEYVSSGEKSGRLVLRQSAPMHDAVYATWEGTFRSVFELLEMKTGRVGEARVSQEGKMAEIEVSWE